MFPTSKMYQKIAVDVFDRPAIYLPLSVLMSAGITDIGLVTDADTSFLLQKLLKNGQSFGIKITYLIEDSETVKGIPHSLLIAKEFLNGDDFLLVLGDTFFADFSNQRWIELGEKNLKEGISTIYQIPVRHSSRFAVANYKSDGQLKDIIEKPQDDNSALAISGIYFLKGNVVDLIKLLKMSRRNELEIVDLLNLVLKSGKLSVIDCDRSAIWIDIGTPSGIFNAAIFIKTFEETTGQAFAAPELIALNQKLMEYEVVYQRVLEYPESTYKEMVIRSLQAHRDKFRSKSHSS